MALPLENIYGHTKKLNYILAKIAHLIEKNGSATILDFGCGNGVAVGQHIIHALPEPARYIGVDIHQPSIDYANAHFATRRATFSSDLPELGSCDMIIYADVLEHVANPSDLLASHSILLRPGGMLVGCIPNGWGPYEIESWLDKTLHLSPAISATNKLLQRALGRRIEVTAPYNSDSSHVQFYRRQPFVAMLESAGFAVTDFSNGTFFGGMLSERLMKIGGEQIFRMNANIADWLPQWAVSTWLFSAERR
jgi:2-polyprenyl-3-methyl-5-hydroxy-6-metoxy-1,4-benzoquinol methylase